MSTPATTEQDRARLNAAAPALLASVQALLIVVETGVMSRGAVRAAKAAVEAATGEKA